MSQLQLFTVLFGLGCAWFFFGYWIGHGQGYKQGREFQSVCNGIDRLGQLAARTSEESK